MRKIVLIGLILLTSGCGGGSAREILGLGRNSPDEFAVVSRPPLSTPPEFSLRPPQAGRQATNLPDSESKARSLITGEETASGSYDGGTMMGPADTAVGVVTSGSLASSGESQLLNRAGANKADSNIRDQLENEHTNWQVKTEDDDSWLQWEEDGAPGESTVDAAAEKKRLEENKKSGKSVTEGETPAIEPKDKGILGDLF
jgi:hypothetical protein